MIRVLIVDDDHIVCRCLKKEINWENIGCEEPVIAYNGVDALRIIEEKEPDIVISDIRMPVMDGTVLCRQIYEKYPDITILILSAYEDFKVAQLAIRYNVKGYILKPLDRKSLAMLEEMLKGATARQSSLELAKKIASNGYSEYLEKIIEDKNEVALEEFLGQLSVLEKDAEVNQVNLWMNMMTPIISYRYKKQYIDSKLLLEEEKQMREMIGSLAASERIALVREKYKAVMWENSEALENRNIVREIQKVVREGFASPDLNVNRLGSMFHMSPVYLGSLFVERTGVKLMDYIMGMRLEYACEQLRSTTRAVKEIAEASGYPDSNYFARIFKRKIGMTPMEYRQKYQKLDSRRLWKETEQ